jgi:glycosyltransferase involved in cell wall biosynthesis
LTTDLAADRIDLRSDRYRPRHSRGELLAVTIVLPCHDEASSVLEEIARITAAMDVSEYAESYELLVLDDGSTDGTLGLLTDVLPSYPNLRVLTYVRNGGSGAARRIGTQEALGAVVVWTDADLTYPNELVPELVRHLDANPGTAQVIAARRGVSGGVARRLASWLTGTHVVDLDSSLRAFRREVATPYLRTLPAGSGAPGTLTTAFLADRHAVSYVAVEVAPPAAAGFHPVRVAYRALTQSLRMVVAVDPLKALLPVALWLFGLGALDALYDIVRYTFRLSPSSVLLLLAGLLVGGVALLADLAVRSRDRTST